jgi:hypothetical protein
VVAYFPQAWQSDSNCRWLEEGYHDVPWTEPELVRELVKIPQTNRFAEVLAKLKALFGDFVT